MANIALRRYDRSRFYAFNETLEDFDALDSPFVRDLVELKSQGSVTISADLVNGLDLIAEQIYGDDEFWWIIAEFNKLDDPFDLVIGDQLRYPNKQDIEDLMFKHSAILNQFVRD